ncbi:PREDICTED: translocator protein homolog [Camelina sativa]|uniref:Translocator protein homolog n=1 Tax=Camelina sativa TaxID=90675 RepID=A0ABM0ZP45_CAMSA|nr:PREDICTED: translocator protein homolog [Camelina sativa]
MDSQDIRYRGGDDRDAATTAMAETERKHADDNKGKLHQKRAMAKRGLRSLTVAVAAPVLVTLFATFFLGTSDGYGNRARSSSWIPPLWLLHTTCLASSCLMGLAAWLVWVDGGFHKKPNALYLYLAQFLVCLLWDPVTFRLGSGIAGLAVWLGQSAALFGCFKAFSEISPVAGNLVKPCLAWAAFVAAVNVKLAIA